MHEKKTLRFDELLLREILNFLEFDSVVDVSGVKIKTGKDEDAQKRKRRTIIYLCFDG